MRYTEKDVTGVGGAGLRRMGAEASAFVGLKAEVEGILI